MTSDLAMADSADRLPLHTAVDWRNFGSIEVTSISSIHDTVALLLQNDYIRKYTINARGLHKQTPLYLAAGYRYLPILRQLLDYGADPLIYNSDGRNMLHILFSSAINSHLTSFISLTSEEGSTTISFTAY